MCGHECKLKLDVFLQEISVVCGISHLCVARVPLHDGINGVPPTLTLPVVGRNSSIVFRTWF